MASSKFKLYKPGQLITVKYNDYITQEEGFIVCRVTKRTTANVCKECIENNGRRAKEICRNLKCNVLGFDKYPKLVKLCKKQT